MKTISNFEIRIKPIFRFSTWLLLCDIAEYNMEKIFTLIVPCYGGVMKGDNKDCLRVKRKTIRILEHRKLI